MIRAMRGMDWHVLGGLRDARDCRRIREAIRVIEDRMARVGRDHPMYPQLCRQHAQWLQTLGNRITAQVHRSLWGRR